MERTRSVASTGSAVNEMDVVELEKHFGIDADSEPLKGAWTASLRQGVGTHSGKLYLTNQRICYFSKGLLSQFLKSWEFAEILDIDKASGGKNIVLVTTSGKKYSFGSFENIEKTMNAVQRTLYHAIGNSAIHVAVENRDYDRVRSILELDPSKVNQFNKTEQLPLHLAFSKNDSEMVKLLLEYYSKHRDICDINLRHDKTKNTPLHSACREPNIDDEILRLLINFEGIDVDVKNADDNTPLHYFCEKNESLLCKKTGKLLIEKSHNPKELVSTQNRNKETAMHKAMFNKKVRLFMVDLLVKYDAQLNVKSDTGNTPLHYAIRYRREDLVRTLIKAGADVSVKTAAGQSPLELAREEMLSAQGVAGRSQLEQEAIIAATNIESVLTHIEDLRDILKRVGVIELAAKFIREELYEPDVLAAVTETTLEKLGIQIKVGPQIKLMKEIEAFKSRLAEKKAEEERRLAEEKKKRTKVDDDEEDDTLVEDPTKLRGELGLAESWEVEYNELEFTKKLGAGASGKVYKGLCRGKEVAIKVLLNVSVEETMEEFKKELHIMTTVRSPYMVTFFGATISPKLCMVMEYCSKGSLYHVLNDRTFTWNWDLMFRAALDMSYGMEVLHTWNPAIVHRDLKSLNLLVTSDFRIKVCDFGLSRFTAGSNLETFKKLCGTFAYCAPEIFNGGSFTIKSDVFSMGIVIWELIIKLLKGKYEQPYSEFKNLTYDFQIMVQAAAGLRPTLPANCPASLSKLFADCTSPQVESRPTAGDVVSRLKDIRKEYRKDKAAWDALVVN